MVEHGHGRGHWLMARMTAMPLIPLFFYFLYQLKHESIYSRAEFIQWLQQPVTATGLVFFIFCAFTHASLGVEEIIEDYVAAGGAKKIVLGLNKIFFFVLGAACLFAVMTLHYGEF